MFSTIKTYALAALAVLTGILAALWQYQKAKFKSAQLKGVEEAREVEKKATDKMVEGLDDEAKIQADRTTNRDSFMD